MMKLTHWVGVLAAGLVSVSGLSGCSSTTDTPMMSSGGTTGAGGTGSVGGAAAGGAKGTQLQSPTYFTTLKGADITVGMPAPAAYKTAGCNACHGENAEGTIIGPENRFTPKDYAVAVVRNGRNNPDGKPSAMVAFAAATLSDADLDAINVWQNSFPKPTTGQGMYQVMCGNCHGPTAGGGSAPIAIMGKPKADVQMFVRNGFGANVANRAEYMPKFDTTLLTDADLALIETYLGSM